MKEISVTFYEDRGKSVKYGVMSVTFRVPVPYIVIFTVFGDILAPSGAMPLMGIELTTKLHIF